MSLEDLYRDFILSDEAGATNNVPLPAFSFPDLPDAFTTDSDKENWKTLGDALNKSNGYIAILDDIVKELVSTSDRFRYIGDSIKWLKLELERMCEMPPLTAEESEHSSISGDEEHFDPLLNDALASKIDINSEISEAELEQEGSTSGDSSQTEGMFQPSEFYDWSEIEDDVHLLQEVILMNPLMATYEMFDSKVVSEIDLDELFAQPFLANWDGEVQETLLEVLKILSHMFVERYQAQHLDSSDIRHDIDEETKDVADKESRRAYPSPKLSDSREIRILEVLPGSEGQPIECLLSIEHLWDDPRYEALSYVWGSFAEMKPIQLNKVTVEITSNLETALQHLRDDSEPRRLWIDALCINQLDPDEKQAQVKLMSEIYPAADNVLCWLGPEANDSDFIMQQLEKRSDDWKGSDSSSGEQDGPTVDSIVEAVDEDEESFNHGLLKLISREWWSRLWTCQEFVLTLRDPVIICGKHSLPWSIFCPPARASVVRMGNSAFLFGGSDIAELAPKVYWEMAENLYGFDSACGLRTTRGFSGLSKYEGLHPISAMAIITRRYQCTDSRDKLFGILSFLLGPHRALLPPNYMQTPDSVNLKYSAATLMISGSGHLYNYLSIGNSTSTALPSWAIDFSSQTANGQCDPGIISGPKSHLFRVSKDRKLQCTTIGPRLIIRGIILDRINTVQNTQNDESPNPSQIYVNLTEFQRTVQGRGSKELGPQDSAFLIQHLRTVDSVYGLTTFGALNDKNFHQAFERWVPPEDRKDFETKSPAAVEQASMESTTYADSSPPSPSSTEILISDANMQLLLYSITGRKLFITRSGFFGIGVSEIRAGDLVVVLFGFDIPMILREDGNHFTLVGAARVGGIMEGQLMKFVEDGILHERSFVIR